MSNFPPITAMPFGKVPVLEIDGEKYSHTIAICSFLGEKFNLAGSNEIEKMQIETAALFFYDLIGSKYKLIFIGKNWLFCRLYVLT